MTIATESIQAPASIKANPARVFVMENQAFLRLGLGAFLKAEPEFECCGESGYDDDFHLAVRPDLVLIGTAPDDPGGLKAIAEFRASGFPGKMIVLSQRENSARAEAALRRGAHGLLTKDDSPEILREAIQTVLNGEIFVSDHLRSKLVSRIIGGGESSPLDHLTNREHEVLELIGAGINTRSIADRLGVSSKTVDVHRANIKKKLKIKTVNELIRFAARYFD